MGIPDLRFLVSTRVRRAHRRLSDMLCPSSFVSERSSKILPHIVKEHSLPIYRHLQGVDRRLFDNKRINLALAISCLNNVVILPGEIFSLWRLVGPPDSMRGYKEGLAIRLGRPSKSIGGGLCQLANAIFWLALHSDLRVLERHRHSLDLFPDDDRKIPFGTGATIVYNYKDLRLHNPTAHSYQLCFELTDDAMLSRLRSSRPVPHRYRVVEEGHRFKNMDGILYRSNTIFREKLSGGEDVLAREMLFQNHCRCQYKPEEVS